METGKNTAEVWYEKREWIPAAAWEENIWTWDTHSQVVIRSDVLIPAVSNDIRISEEKALSYVNALIGDRTLYHSDGTTVYTVEHIDNEIDYLQYHLDTNLENWEWRFADGPVIDFPQIKKNQIQSIQERISLLKHWRKTAPNMK